MTDRDERHRRNAQRLRGLTVDLAAEVVARGGSLTGLALTEEERAEATAKAPWVFRRKFRELQRRFNFEYGGGQAALHESADQHGGFPTG